ncbi:electron transfer flavoprotein subunit alpha/FixB family protein [Cycloclasticus pugetii]|uniref:electron transfer flavoprotein subunit alpha/FixB family protein n=1 Tax=Cycloclasticus pugetii TaxID=34068 RepID=UPI000920C7A4|nr:electron transfer flavoprotein subunit alpha/FixB family protein [Cycloclasticus pugetii]SHJ44789.1 electron transfer flavoprotein alpha subunit apoprotein [Cycloclasticus pugetii]
MSKVLVIAEHNGSELNGSTARAVACASELGLEAVDVAVLASDGQLVAEQAAKLTGVATVILVQNEVNEHAVAALLAPQIEVLASEYSHVFAPSTTFGKDLMPRVAAHLGVPQISDIMRVESATVFDRPVYAGNAVVTVEAPEGLVVGTVRTASYSAVSTEGSAVIETREVAANLPSHTRYVGLTTSGGGDRPDLQAATKVVSGGRGVGSEENFSVIYSLADKLGAGVGASRAAVDAGFIPNDHQVGQTGKIIAPELYMAFGISGAIQHLAGIKDAGTIVAVNKDADAPIFEVADYGLVGDLFEVIEELEKAL